MNTFQFTALSLADTQALAACFAARLTPGECLLLRGDLGAGKSAFSRAIIQHMAGQEIEVPSPTYTLVQVYPMDAVQVYHFDLYRIGEPDEVYELEWEIASSEGICLVEWPQRLGHLTPPDGLHVHIRHDDQNPDVRHFEFKSSARHWADRMTEILGAVS